MSEKRYVHSGAFLLCDKCVAPVPVPLTVTSQQTVSLPGGLMANTFDELPLYNIPPFGVCALTHGPCTYAPQPPGWSPVMETVEVGPLGGKALLEDSKMRCIVGGQISIFLTKAAALATLPDWVSQKFDSAYAYLESVGPPFGGELRDELGEAKGVWQGVASMATGLWELVKMKAAFDQKVDDALLFAVQHPVAAAHAVADGTQHAAAAGWQAVTDKDNWLTAGQVAINTMPGVMVAKGAIWLSDADNRAKVSAAYAQAKAWEAGLSDYERSTYKGRAVFEIASLLVPETKVAAAGKVGELAKAEQAAEGVGEGMRLLGEVKTGAKAAEQAGAAPRTLEELWAGINKCFREGHPVDIATGFLFTQATDFTLPGPLPLVWERVWLSASTHQGALGHGWSHSYDLGLTLQAGNQAVLRLPDGRLATFDVPAPGERSLHRRHQVELSWEAGGPRIWDLNANCWYLFEPSSPAAPSRRELRLVAVEDAQGQRIRLAYTGNGHLASLLDSAGRELGCVTDAAGRLLAVHAPDPDQPGSTFALITYAYDETGNLRTVTDALGHAAHFTYADRLLTQETTRSGLNFYFEYEGTGPAARCVHTWGDGGIVDTRLRYDSATQTTVWDSYGHEKLYIHQRGLPTYLRERQGSVWRWHYTPAMEVERVVNPLGHATRYTYNQRGQLTSVAYPDGSTLTTRYDERDRPVEATDVLGGRWQWGYDQWGNLTGSTDPAGATTTYSYNEQGWLTTRTDALGQVTRLDYDAQGQLRHLVAPDDSIRSRRCDALGRVREVTDARGQHRHFAYDRAGQLTHVRAPDGNTRYFAYNALGNVVRVEEGQQVIEFGYTPLGLLATRRQDGQAVAFAYDLEGRLTQVTNEQGETYIFTVDAVGQVLEEVGFDGLTRRYERDAAGQVLVQQRPAGRTTTYGYDAAGRVTEMVHNGHERTAYRYLADGTLLEASTADTHVTFERDALGRVLAETQQGQRVSSRYDALGQRTTLSSVLGAAVTFERDAAGRVRQLKADGWQSLATRDGEGLELHRQLSGGLHLDWQYDAEGRLASQRVGIGYAGVERYRRYQWQQTDQLLEVADTLLGTTRFAYDAAGALTAATYPGGEQQLRQLDAAGNLFRTAGRTDRHYGRGGQLREAGGTRYRYDEEGNLISKTSPDGQQWRYVWDGANQLVQVTRPDGYAVTFAYDALGRRVRKRFRGKVTHWLWDGARLLHEWNELEVAPGADGVANLTTWLFEEGNLAPVAKLTKESAYSVVCDHLGTPLAMYTTQGKLTWEMQLDSYGGVRQGRGRAQDCPFRYQGQYEDVETGLYYNRFRYYDPEAGSYISQDPAGILGGDTLYAYVSNPNTYVDSLGLLDEFGIAPYKSAAHVNDNYTAHELLQNAWLRNNNKVTGREGGIARQNPAIALSESPMHKNIGDMQRASGLHDPAVLKSQSAMRNINTNSVITKNGIADELVRRGWSLEDARSFAHAKVLELRKQAIQFAIKNNLINTCP